MFPNLDQSKISEILKLVQTGNVTVEDFNKELDKVARSEMDRTIEENFERLFVKMNNKHNGKSKR